MTDLSIVLPTYNEVANIVPLLETIEASLSGRHFEVVVVDDNSPDGTARLAEDYAKNHSFVRVIRRQGVRSLSAAVVDGFRQCQGRFLGVMDADLSHDVRILPRMLDALQAGEAEIVVGSRRVPGGGADHWPWYRQLTSRVATMLAHALLPIRLMDPMSGYFVLRRDVFESCADRLRPTGYKILLEILMASPEARVMEVPYIFKDRKQGYSKLSGNVILSYIRQLVTLRCSHRSR